jgi:hypothetical protein
MQALALILGSGLTALAECLALRAGYFERFLPQAAAAEGVRRVRPAKISVFARHFPSGLSRSVLLSFYRVESSCPPSSN